MAGTQEDPTRQVSYLQQCLSANKKPLGLFLGAGCPMAIRVDGQSSLIPDITEMTQFIRNRLVESTKHERTVQIVDGHFETDGRCNPTVEDILTHIRALSAVAGKDKVRGLTSEELDQLDSEICSLIHEFVDKELPKTETPYHHVASWVEAVERESPVEVFTTNYDLLLEQAFETQRVPYFDGFAGVRKPIFDPLSMDEDSLPSRWARVWKLHGSINWYQNSNQDVFRGTTSEEGQRRVIHPSHLKYQESRRMPYLAMVDRLREFLRRPTAALILCGYSFHDAHINEAILQGLRYTKTAVAFALLFKRAHEYQEVTALATKQPNLTVLARDGGVIGGQHFKWVERNSETVSEDQSPWINWACSNNGMHAAEFKLGDFAVLGELLQELVGDVQQQQRDAPNAQ